MDSEKPAHRQKHQKNGNITPTTSDMNSSDAVTRTYFFPAAGRNVEATSLEEANRKLAEEDMKSDEAGDG